MSGISHKILTHDFSFVQVGDRVELADGYEKFGDASGGPLQPGDRGVVVEVQNGSPGERFVILA